MKTKIGLGICGKIRLIGSNYNDKGVLEQVFDREEHNLITHDGFDLILNCLGQTSQPSEITHMAIGSGAVEDIDGATLTSEDQRNATVYAHVENSLTCTFTSTFTTVVAATEYGLLNAAADGSLFNTAGFAAITVDSLQIVATLTLSDVG